MLTHKYVSIKHIKAAVDPFSGLFGCTFTSYCLFMARFLVAFTQMPKINNQHLPESFFLQNQIMSFFELCAAEVSPFFCSVEQCVCVYIS